MDPRAPTSTNATWLRLDHAARLAQVHPATLRREIRRGTLRATRIGGRKSIRIRAEWIDSWLEASTTQDEGGK